MAMACLKEGVVAVVARVTVVAVLGESFARFLGKNGRIGMAWLRKERRKKAI